MQKDFFHLPPKYSGDVKVYISNTAIDVKGFQIWQKPKGASLVSMFVIGGGGGGGGGFSRTAGSAGGGGAGGACSGISRFICPAIFLPDTLYIQVGNGGQGGAASSNGGAGINSYILSSKTNVVPNIIVYSGLVASPPGGGGAGTGATGGTGGTVPGLAISQSTNTWGQWFSNQGLVGGAGGAQTGAVGTAITAWGGLPLSPGAGGAGCTTTDFAGGPQTPTAILDIGSQGYYPSGAGGIVPGGTAAGTNVDGNPGINRITPFYNSGGAGGGSNNSGQAGHGGTGGYGCGGGGGGAGTTGGRGGNGGSGIVIIVTM